MFTIIIVIAIILLVNTFSILSTCCPGLLNKIFQTRVFDTCNQITQVEKVESSLLSSGLSILGIVIAVWTGLSITNAIDKKRIDAIDKQIDSITMRLEKNSNYIDSVNKHQNKVHKEIFINTLLSSADDLATYQLITFFENESYTSDIQYLMLIEVEELFKKVYSMRESKFLRNTSLLANAEKGIELSEKLLEKCNNQTLTIYAKYRKAEFMFYSGYCCVGEERLNYFTSAIKIYEEVYTTFEADIPIFEANFDYLHATFRECNKNPKMSAYFCNSIGEAYSKICETGLILQDSKYSKKTIESYGKKAIFYCSYAANWINRETYWRNLGCAIERHHKVTDETYDKLYNVYNEALNISATKSSFKVILSVCDKYFNRHLNIKNVDVRVGRTIPLSNASYENTWNNLEQPLKEKLLEVLCRLEENSEYAKTIFPSSEIGYTYSCIYHRDMCLIKGQTKDVAKQHLSEAIHDLGILKVINPNGALTKILSDDLDALSKNI